MTTAMKQRVQAHEHVPMRIEGVVSYQALLRALGRFLDDRHARNTQVMETSRQLVVGFTHGTGNESREVVYLPHADLLTADVSFGQTDRHRRGVNTSAGQRCYEDIFRALGRRLDEDEAGMILLDEIGDEGFLLTYQVYVPSTGYMPRKRLAVLGHEDQEVILAEARARRTAPRRSLFGLRAS